MADPNSSLASVLERLVQRGHLRADDVDRAGGHLEENAAELGTPLYVGPLAFVGALLAAVMLSIGIAAALDLEPDGANLLVLGGIYLATAVVLHRSRRNLFTDYMALALSIGAHAFILSGAADLSGPGREKITLLCTALGLCIAMYGVYRDFLHRFGSCLLVFIMARIVLPETEFAPALHGFVGFCAAASTYLLTRDVERPSFRPLAYASAFGLLVILLPIGDRTGWFIENGITSPWLSNAILGAALLFALHWASQRSVSSRSGARANERQKAMAVVWVAFLCFMASPGILAALFLIVLGHAAYHGQIALLGLGAVPLFLWNFYYDLDLDLLTKSGVLVGSGALLLLARWTLGKSPRSELGEPQGRET